MVGTTRSITQAATDDLSRYGGVYGSPAHTLRHQATTVFSPAASVTPSTGFVPSLASPSKGEHLASHGGSYTPTLLAPCVTPCPPSAPHKMSPALQSAGSSPAAGGKKRSSTLLEDKRKRKCWEAEAAASPKVAIATPTVKSAAKATVPVALTSPTSRRTLSPVVGAELDQVTLSGTLPPHKSSTYPTVSNKKDAPAATGPGLSTTSSLRAIRPCKTSEPSSTLPLTSTTTSGIPVGIAVARQRSTSSHVAVTNTTTTSYPDLSSLAGNNGHVGNTGLTATHMSGNSGLTHMSGSNGLTAAHMPGNNGLTATHNLAGNIHTGTANGLHSVAATMGPGQCLPAMTLLTCDDGNNPNATAWSSPWHYPMPMESAMPQLSQPGNLQLVRDPSTGQFLLLPTASFDPMPGTVVWPTGPPGAGGLILPQPPHPHTTPLILDNRLVALSTPAPAPLSPTGGDKQRRGPTLVKLDDNSLTGVMMPSNDYSKPALGSDTNGYALIHHSPSFINPNFSAISSSSGSFLIQHISRNNNAPMHMTTAPTLFNNGTRTNNLLISTQQLPAGQQLTLASPSGDMKDNIATICYDNLYHNTTTTTMFNLQQTTSVLNQQTTSTQQMSTTSILVNDKISGNSSFNVESQLDSCNTSNYNQVETVINGNSEGSAGYSNEMDSGDADYCSNQNENSTGNEDSQTSAGTQDEEEEEAEEETTTRTDAGNQTDMPDEAKADSDECSQDSSVQNDISDKPMSLNNGDENSQTEEIDKTSLCEKDGVVGDVQGSATVEAEVSFKIDTRHVSITPIVKTTCFSENVSTCDNYAKDETETAVTISILDCDTNNTVNVNGLSSNKKDSPESKKKIKQMPSLYPIHRFLPNMKNDVKSADTRLVGFRSMPLLEDATKPVKKNSETLSNDKVSDVKSAKEENESATKDVIADDTALVVNVLMGLGNNGRLLKENNLETKTEQQKYVGCDKEGSHNPTDINRSDKDNQVIVKPTPRVFSVSNLLDKNFSSKNWTSAKPMVQPEVPTTEKSDKPSQMSESSVSPVETEQRSGQHNTDCESDGRDEILEVANILCSALFTSGNERSQCPFPDANKAFDSEERSSRKDSESSGTSCESGVDLSGLELLSNSIEQLERAKDGGSGKVCHREESCAPEDDGVLSDATSHDDSGISRGLDLLCALAQERIKEESEVATLPQRRYDSAVWTPRRLTKQDAPSRLMMSSDTDDEMFIQPYKPRLYKRPAGVPYKEVSHTYRSLKSEQETRRVLASKQTYHYAPPTSIDLKEMETRKLLAEIQREFREAQKELTRLTPKKSPHTPPELGWRAASCEAAGSGGQSGGKRKPGRPRKTDKDVESLKHSGKKVRDMITDRSSSPSPAKHGKERIEPRTKLSVQMPSTPTHFNSTQTKSTEQSPPVLTPFSNSPLDIMESSRPPTLVKRHETSTSAVGGSYYRGRFLHDDDSEDSDQTEPPQLSPESACASRKRGRPKKQAAPESPTLKRQFTPEPVKKPPKPTFVSIVLANKNKQHAKPTAPTVWDDEIDYKPNKIRPKLKAEAKVKTLTMPDSDDDVSDLEDREPMSITVRKPSLAAGGTHVKISKLSDGDTFRKSSGQDSSEAWSKACKKQNGQESDGAIVGKQAKKASSPETNVKKHKHNSESSKALNNHGSTTTKKHKDNESLKASNNHETSAVKHKYDSESSKASNNHESNAKKHKLDGEPSKSVHETSTKKHKNDSDASRVSHHENSVKKHKPDAEHDLAESGVDSKPALPKAASEKPVLSGGKRVDSEKPVLPKRADSEKPALPKRADSERPVLPSVRRAKRAESGSSVGSAVSCGNTVPCETEQRECGVTVEFLRQHEDASTRVLVLNEGLLYAGQLTAISPPDIYGVQLDGERAHRPNIYSQEEVLRDVILEVKLALSSVRPGKRMCAYWSQQYRCLYPGVVVSETTSRAGAASPTFVNVEFDDGDSGSINVEDIRMLPQDFPLMTCADPLLTLGGAAKRKRRHSSASVDEVERKRRNSCTSVDEAREKLVLSRVDATIVEEEEEERERGESTAPVRDEKAAGDGASGDKADGSDSSGKVRSKSHKLKKRKRSREEKREHKKHKKHKHKHRHKEKRRRSSSTELSNSGNSVTEEHIKLAIKPIAEIVHKEDEDPLKIVVKRDVICETHIVTEPHKEVGKDSHHSAKEGGKVVEKCLVTPVEINVEEAESNDAIVMEEKVDGLSEDSVDSVNVDEELESDEVNGCFVNNVTVNGSVQDETGVIKVLDGKVEAANDKIKDGPEVNEEAHESLVLKIRTTNACPKILHERKSMQGKDSDKKALPERCDKTETPINGKVDDVKPKKVKKSGKTNKDKCVAMGGKSKKKKQTMVETVDETKVQKKKKSKVNKKEKVSFNGKSVNEKEHPIHTEKITQDDQESKPDLIEKIVADPSNTSPKTLTETIDTSSKEKPSTNLASNSEETLICTDKASNSADKSSNSTDKASNSTDKSSNSTDKPSNSTDKASNSTDKASNSTDKASNSTDKASNSTEKPSNSTDKASNSTDKASNSTDKASNSTDKPSNATDKPSNSADKSSNSTEKPSISKSDKPTEPSTSKCPTEKARRKSPKAKPSKERQPSLDSKSSMTHFLPEKQLWDWAGTSYKRCTTKRKGRKLFYKSIQRGDECLSVGDCAVFLSTETDQPYIGKIDGFWESYASMNVKVKWFYHPEETVGCPLTLPCYQGALFEACHFDENDIQTISHKCQVLPLPDYRARLAETKDSTDLYYLAGLYDHINRRIQFEPGVDPTGGQETASNSPG